MKENDEWPSRVTMRRLDRVERKSRRHHDRVERLWKERRKKVDVCPDCGSGRIGLNESHAYRWHKYCVECADCYYCGESRPTMRWAIRAWNRDPGTYGRIYKDGGRV